MADQDVFQLGAGQGVIDRHDGAAGIAEHHLHPQPLQGGDQQTRTRLGSGLG